MLARAFVLQLAKYDAVMFAVQYLKQGYIVHSYPQNPPHYHQNGKSGEGGRCCEAQHKGGRGGCKCCYWWGSAVHMEVQSRTHAMVPGGKKIYQFTADSGQNK